MLMKHAETYMCYERTLNSGKVAEKLYLIEEVENRPSFVRISMLVPNCSQQESSKHVKNMNSLRNFIMCQNRPEMVMESLSMLKQAQPDVD